MQEIAADGGALTVDPHDDQALVTALRRLLTDDELRTRLHRAALARPPRTWDMYADEVWDFLVSG
jgi:glycosyltransferase involved in cell wall biosynthesis